MLIPAVSVLASITLLPALLVAARAADQPAARDAEAVRRRRRAPSPASGRAGRGIVTRRPLPIFLARRWRSSTLVVIPAFHINPSDAELKNEPAAGDADAGQLAVHARRASRRACYLPHVVLVENGATPAVARDGRRGRRRDARASTARPLRPPWRKGGAGLVEAFGTDDANSRSRPRDRSRDLQHDVLPRPAEPGRRRDRLTLGGVRGRGRATSSAPSTGSSRTCCCSSSS